MSSEVAAKWMNSSAPCTSRFLPSLAFSQYSIALTSWLVSASISLICSASFSAKSDDQRLERGRGLARERLQLARSPGSAASAISQASSTRTR